MAFVNAVVLVLLPWLLLPQRLSATVDFLSPLLSPVFGDVCKDVECGKGTCKPSKSSTFSFECECNPGWKQTRSAGDDFSKFLPCIVPNCTLSHSCSIGPPPALEKPKTANSSSLFDPCHWVDCGGGSCNKTSMFSYACVCEAGYYNLLNATAFPCFKECSVGMDCSNLGISLPNSSSTAASPPALSNNNDVCKDVECGKGTCKPSKNGRFSFECECNPGWKQTSSADDDFFKFLPCIVPNCTLNHSCSIAPPPAQERPKTANSSSLFDPCHWVDCGGGSCNKISMFSYACVCEAGYYNLLNVTAFPCFKECSVGMDCSNLGISPTNSSSTTAPPAALSDSSNNEGSSILQGSFLWLVILITSLVMIQLK